MILARFGEDCAERSESPSPLRRRCVAGQCDQGEHRPGRTETLDRTCAVRLVRTIRETRGHAFHTGKIGPETCLGQKFNLRSQLCRLTQANRDAVDAAAG